MALVKEFEALTKIRLTSGEIGEIVGDCKEWFEIPDRVANAQIKKFREWLKSEVLEDCHEGYSNVMCFHKRALRELEDDCKA